MFRRSSWLGAKWVTGAAFAAAVVLEPAIGSSEQISGFMQVTATVISGGGSLSVARSEAGNSTGSSNAVIIKSQGGEPYLLSLDQGLNATGRQRNLRGNAGIAPYKLCWDPSCATLWATNDDPATGTLITPAGASTVLPLTVVRAASASDDESYADVVTLTMYF